ncbi:MAG: tRNA uridine-5-carboxymethylaminomethyl(34) synthesis enzyme MnmG [Fibrobacter sp.]|jgi:tRNA uridine 5-carboxymethylaminomethyl modification enzyme|nr:tRNA uridine-5-carboxymethylaminomethyl(34) synthesis enzyme MnmG [Fibrobacter sp.]
MSNRLNMTAFDVVVIGGGHAGIEAVHAARKLGMKAALVTMDLNAIGRMSCNPAIGGVSKGQIVRDIDALGGLMGILADRAGIQFRMLNQSKGPAVWGPRAQSDMELYAKLAQETLQNLKGLELIKGELLSFERLADSSLRLQISNGMVCSAKALVIASGTFLSSRMFTGLSSSIGGRVGEPSADSLSECIARAGIRLRRLKTGTPSRLDPDSIDFAKCEVQPGDAEPWAFSDRHVQVLNNQAVCWITRTNLKTHEILRSGFKDSPMFSGKIKGLGPRYCPSIEDKINRFGDKDGHQLFLEPETAKIGRIYVNGFSSSLPEEIQAAALRSIQGLEQVKILQIGYAVEYDAIDATQLYSTYECKSFPGLYFAGQVCGTSGYEEAAGQGLIAGINAALKIKGEDPFILGRSESYIGVMTDDLTHFLLEEPYRMFTSRAEYRLFLRADNAEARLKVRAQAIGMIEDTDFRNWEERKAQIARVQKRLHSESGEVSVINEILAGSGQSNVSERTRWAQILRRPGVNPEVFFKKAFPEESLTRRDQWFIFAEETYAGFFERQAREIEHEKKMENIRLPADMDYEQIPALSKESRQRLSKAKPLTVGQASRIPGIRPTDAAVLARWTENVKP